MPVVDFVAVVEVAASVAAVIAAALAVLATRSHTPAAEGSPAADNLTVVAKPAAVFEVAASVAAAPPAFAVVAVVVAAEAVAALIRALHRLSLV